MAHEASSWAKKRMFCDLIPTSIEGGASDDACLVGPVSDLAVLVPSPHEWIVGHDLPNAVILAVQSSQPIRLNDILGHRAGNDRLAGSLGDWEVT